MNVMKNKLIAALSVLLVAGVFSCADDVTLSGLPKRAPFIQPLSDVPGLLFAGVVTDVSASFNTTTTNPVSSVTFEVFKKGSTTVEKSGVIAPTPAAGVVKVTWTGTNSGLSTLAAGDYIMQVTGSNSSGKEVATSSFTVPDYVIPQACQVTNMITLIMLTPHTEIPATDVVSAIGGFAGSGWSTDLVMTRIKPGVYCVAAPLVGGDGYKYRINSSWGAQEKKPDCSDGDNRNVPASGYPKIYVENVNQWGGYGC